MGGRPRALPSRPVALRSQFRQSLARPVEVVQYTREQLEKMLEFTRMVTAWYSQIDRLPTPALQRLFRGGARLAKLFSLGSATASETAEASAGSTS